MCLLRFGFHLFLPGKLNGICWECKECIFPQRIPHGMRILHILSRFFVYQCHAFRPMSIPDLGCVYSESYVGDLAQLEGTSDNRCALNRSIVWVLRISYWLSVKWIGIRFFPDIIRHWQWLSWSSSDHGNLAKNCQKFIACPPECPTEVERVAYSSERLFIANLYLLFLYIRMDAKIVFWIYVILRVFFFAISCRLCYSWTALYNRIFFASSSCQTTFLT